MKKSRKIIGKILIILLALNLPIVVLFENVMPYRKPFLSPVVSFILIASPIVFYVWLVMLDIEKKSSLRIEMIYYTCVLVYSATILYAKVMNDKWELGFAVPISVITALISLIIFSIFMAKGITKDSKAASLRVLGGLVLAVVITLSLMI